mgnify:CR=1 FL=1
MIGVICDVIDVIDAAFSGSRFISKMLSLKSVAIILTLFLIIALALLIPYFIYLYPEMTD